MSQIAPGSIHKFLTGETVTGDDTQVATSINIAFELLRQAGNDTDAKVGNTYTKSQTDAALGVRDSAIAQLSVGQIPPVPGGTPTLVSLANGLQVYNNLQSAPLENLSIKGSTLTNLLGRDGNCEDVSKWGSQSNATIALDTTNKVNGNSSIKITSTASGYCRGGLKSIPVPSSKKFLVSAYFKNGTATNLRLQAENATPTSFVYTNATGDITDATKFNFAYLLVDMSARSNTNIDIEFWLNATASGQVGYVDSVDVYELSSADFTAAGSMTAAQIAAKYPYVDDVKYITAPVVTKYGENLLPTFNEWTLHANAIVTSPYTLTLNATGNNQSSRYRTPVIPNQTYTFTGATGYDVNELDSNGTYLRTKVASTTSYTFTVSADASFVEIITLFATTTGTYTFTNPMLNLGATAKPFKPRNDDMLAFPTVQLASSVDGTIYDTLFKRDGKYFVEKRFKDMVMDGSLPWTYSADLTGFKQVALVIANAVDGTNKVVKYDGKIIPNPFTALNAADQSGLTTNTLYITVADTDSGWGETYTPTAAEIQAYFYGWRMYEFSSGINTPATYNGTGTKAWVPISDITITGTRATTTLPTGPVTQNKWTPYKLTYQLATSTFEEIQVDAGMSLHEGLNQIEIGQGVVIREKVNPYNGGIVFNINDASQPSSLLRLRTNRVTAVYKNGKEDKRWKPIIVGNLVVMQIQAADYDPTATYEVSYIALDQYLLSAPVQAVTGETASNLKTVVDTLAANSADRDARISANEILARQIYQVPKQTTANMTLYVDATNGADNNDGSAGKPFKTIQRAIDNVPQVINHTVNINVADGTYSESVTISGFSGKGTFTLTGNVTAYNVNANNVLIYKNSVEINVQGFNLTSTTSEAVNAVGNIRLIVFKCQATGAAAFAGLSSNCGFVSVNQCTFSNKTYSIFSARCLVASTDNLGTGNTYGIFVTSGGQIYKTGTQPTGTTNESNSGGGIISSGVINPWGDNTQTQRSAVGAYQNFAQAMSAGTVTKVQINAVDYDQQTEFNNTTYRFTAKSAGIYQINACFAVNVTTATATLILSSIYLNGGEIKRLGQYLTPASVNQYTTGGATTLKLNAGDYIELYGLSSVAFNTLANMSYLNITRIA